MAESNKLQVMVDDSGLEQTKADYILEKFKDSFKIASDWEKRAKEITVIDDSQTDKMQLARAGRLILKDMRVAIEKERKTLKEQSLREGKAIDGIANVLKALIIPTEKYLDSQEHFTEYRIKAEQEAHRAAVEARMEVERLEEEKRQAEKDAAEREAMRKENEALRLENEEKEKAMKAERQAAAEEAQRQQDIINKQNAAADQARIEAAKQREELREKLEQKEKAAGVIVCPQCGHKIIKSEQ